MGEKSYWCESKHQNLVRHQLHQKALYVPLDECACVVLFFSLDNESNKLVKGDQDKQMKNTKK